jgi:hypothetical protein
MLKSDFINQFNGFLNEQIIMPDGLDDQSPQVMKSNNNLREMGIDLTPLIPKELTGKFNKYSDAWTDYYTDSVDYAYRKGITEGMQLIIYALQGGKSNVG